MKTLKPKNTPTHRSLTVASTLVTAAFGLSLLAACTVRTPTTETPIPNDRGIEKTFFQETITSVSAQGTTETKIKPKTFLCGWAPISETGAIASQFLLHGVERAGHCNMEFEITADAIIGRLVNPSYPNDRKRWKPGLTIPIKKHYYYERAKDSYGRETNEFIENSSRSDYSARPMMDLSLEGLEFQNWDIAMFHPWSGAGTGRILNIQDIEWDKKTGFLGFTANMVSSRYGSDISARVRFNFKSFEHDENFKATPYSPSNNTHFNALHVIGEKVEGINQIWSAAKWDLSKTHEIYMHGFPEAYVPIAQKVVDQWNAAFTSIGQKPAFRLNHTKMKHPFDLRYPMMVWVEDPEISAVSPLGVGMAIADVRNGEIQWGQITLYGGMLEHYVKSHLGPTSANSNSAKSSSQSGSSSDSSSVQRPGFFQTYFNPTRTLQPAPGLDSAVFQRLETHLNRILPKADPVRVLQMKFAEMRKRTNREQLQAEDIELAKSEAGLEVSRQNEMRMTGLRTTLTKTFAESMATIEPRREAAETVRKETRELYGFLGAASSEMRASAFGQDEGKLSGRDKLAKLAKISAETMNSRSSRVLQDADRLLVDVGPTLVSALAKSGVSYDDGMKNVIHELIAHEFGHMIGLGHQFKENILPPEGSVPEKYLVELKKDLKNGSTNSTSVMGYKHPLTELLEDPEKVGPGPQDLLTLRYLYNGEYSTYRLGDADFAYVKVRPSGIIPANDPENPEFKTAYFPQCNDFDASFGADPYCNRFDRGHDAQTIVKNYFESLNANMVSRIYSFVDSRGVNTEEAEAYLWWKALTTLGRVRTFYDYMRQKYEFEIRSISKSERDLYEFSRVCSGELEGSKKLQEIFEAHPDLKDLCRVNRSAVKEMMSLMVMPGPDRSRMEWDNANVAAGVTGGDGNTSYSRVFGTHKALSVMPLKLSAINALTSPYPHAVLGQWDSFWTFPIPRFTGSDGLFSYSTMYPFEFTEALAGAVDKNLKFNSVSTNSSTMGLPIMSMGHFIDQQSYGNDSTRMPKDFMENIRNQTSFRFGMKAIILQFKTREDESRVTHFEGELYDPYSDKSQRINEIFLLPGGKLIVRLNSRNFVYPITKMMFINDKMAYAWAYHIEYDDKHDDVLAAHGVKATLEKLNKNILDSCIRGNNDGLASYFNTHEDSSKFPGFLVMSGIADDKEKQLRFLESVNENFTKFSEQKKNALGQGLMPERCEKAIAGVGMIVSTAAVVNGYFLPEVLEYLVK